MNCNRWEIAFLQELIQLGGPESALNEDDGLVKLELVEQFVKLSVFLSLVKLDVVLLKAMKGEFGFIVDVNLKRVLHELLADWSNFLRKSGTEHHDLLLSWCCPEDFLNITAHICQNLVYKQINGR